MKPLIIDATEHTPLVHLDQSSGQFRIEGNSLLDQPSEFYKPVIEWIKAYTQSPNSNTEFQFKFNYLNNESSKSVLDILQALQTAKAPRVVWFFDEENEDMEEIGEEIAELVTIPFEFRHQ